MPKSPSQLSPDRKVRHALFGGTFDPIHLGHLDLIRHVLSALSPETLWVCSARQNPLKPEATVASGVDRAEMVSRAIASLGDPRVRLLDLELKSTGPSYTILTVRHLQRLAPGTTAVVMGNEVFATLPRWHQPKELLNEANLMVLSREPMDPPSLRRTLEEIGVEGLTESRNEGEILWTHGEGRWILPRTISALPFAATALREAIRRYPVRPEGLPDSVWAYIKEKGLYADN